MKLKLYIDEAGRWPLAGPVYVWIIIPLKKFDDSILQDSKKLTEKKREEIYKKIQQLEKDKKLLYSSWDASNKEIDKYGIIKSINLSIKRAFIDIIKKYMLSIKKRIMEWNNGDLIITYLEISKLIWKIESIKNSEKLLFENHSFFSIIDNMVHIEKINGIIIDGNHDFGLSKDFGYNIKTIIKWDDKVSYIGGASIVAKVERDRLMKDIANKYPQYLLERHKWYWTKKHIEAIEKNGLSPIHRKSFTQNITINGI